MNNLLKLSKVFKTRSASAPGYPTLPSNGIVTTEHVKGLVDNLLFVLSNWAGEDLLDKILVAVKYNTIVAKSNRIRSMLREGKMLPEESIVGARYDGASNSLKHVITHYISASTINSTIEELELAAQVIDSEYNGKISKKEIDELWDEYTKESWKPISKIPRSTFAQLVRDAYYVKSFESNDAPPSKNDLALVTLYQTEKTPKLLLDKLGIKIPASRYLGNSILMDPDEYQALLARAPYLIAMETLDFGKIPEIPFSHAAEAPFSIPLPDKEPTIGIIDTPFEEEHPPYFSNWVESHTCINPDLIAPGDRDHGTSVASLIVDGPALNPWLEDGCGRFRVRHFGIALQRGFSSFELMGKIESIVKKNRDIKVWNLSLGSSEQVENNFVSPEAAILDQIQADYGVLFVIAGTNDDEETGAKRIGAPADSINALVVNSVRQDSSPASYVRKGPVLHFHRKPDIAYYGGDTGEQLTVCRGTGSHKSQGTSLAAPLITRKVAYLVYIMGFSCDAAKALIIDSACAWSSVANNELGYGVVPIHINDILETADDEIRFVISGNASSFETYDYEIPVPASKGFYPYAARATLCYTPSCDRNQGVDYTRTELDLHFGRMRKTGIASLKANRQGEETGATDEFAARTKLRKWDNVKHIYEPLTSRTRPKKAYANPMWGLKIRKTSRLQTGSAENQHFALVVTLKELNGVNRFDMFAQNCRALGWTVNEIDIDNRINVYEDSRVEIEWD